MRTWLSLLLRRLSLWLFADEGMRVELTVLHVLVTFLREAVVGLKTDGSVPYSSTVGEPPASLFEFSGFVDPDFPAIMCCLLWDIL